MISGDDEIGCDLDGDNVLVFSHDVQNAINQVFNCKQYCEATVLISVNTILGDSKQRQFR